MGKKKHVLSSLFFKLRDSSPESFPPSPPPPSSSWSWHFCKHPKADSFRFYLNDDSGITCSSSSDTAEEEEDPAVVRRRRSDRLFFDPGGDTSSIMEEVKDSAAAVVVEQEKESPFEDSVAVAVESRNPYGDFRRSMEEVVAAQGLGAGDWERLEELLAWYLSVNGRKTHGFIVGAFLDLLAAMASSASSASASSPFSSSSSSSSASNSFKIEELREEEASDQLPRELPTPSKSLSS
ncbi:transcription repressor OFP13-like [Zingiber officinale]|uniref:transcription repressor OFP13-like n=1 Tax=Zingiber officinale TaxID=94328 RepID=UPI001C4BF997|nr:transcription repressor OFP13-like [Zingiber officinale]